MTMHDDSNEGAAGGDSGGSAVNTMEQRVVAFAEQLGRIVGTVQAKAEGWMDRDALNAQLAGVRDGAADLLEQLGGGKKAAPAKPRQASGSMKKNGKVRASATSGAPAKSAGKGRSGGAVDAPGKKHRRPMPSESAATGSPRGAGSRIAKLKMANENRVMRRRG